MAFCTIGYIRATDQYLTNLTSSKYTFEREIFCGHDMFDCDDAMTAWPETEK